VSPSQKEIATRALISQSAITIDEQLQSAIMTALYNQSMPYQFSCGTGNCTWPSFYSLGVCSTCANVSVTSVHRKCDYGYHPTTCNYTTQGGFNLSFNTTPGIWASTKSVASIPANASDQLATIAIGIAHNYNIEAPNITECSFSWCVKGYHDVSVASGIIKFPNITEYRLNRTGYVNLTFAGNQTSSFWGAYVFSIINPPPSWNANTTWMVNGMDFLSTADFLQSLFTTIDADGTALSLYRSPNVSRQLNSIADNMSHTIRTAANSTDVVGNEQREDVFIRVTWPWLILPILIGFLSILLLILSIITTKSEGKRLWKSSSLVLLFSSLEGRDSSDITSESTAEVENVARTMKRKLDLDPDAGLSFVEG
jgi:hypothetical protein